MPVVFLQLKHQALLSSFNCRLGDVVDKVYKLSSLYAVLWPGFSMPIKVLPLLHLGHQGPFDGRGVRILNLIEAQDAAVLELEYTRALPAGYEKGRQAFQKGQVPHNHRIG